jgi:DNA-binding NarL/FixJ family response regulator
MTIRVLLYEDNDTLREALSFLIDSTDGYHVVGAFGNCLHSESQVGKLLPHVVLMDIEMPGMDGIQGLVRIKKKYPAVDVIMLTVFDDDDRVFKAIQSGATGYLLKKTSPERILECINEVYEGGAPMSPAIARKVMQTIRRPSRDNPAYTLTDRESQVISLLSEGLSYKMVAGKLDISLETVRTYVKRIYEKLQAHSVTEAIAKFRRE